MEKLIVTVTGATGYIASWIVKYLLEDGHDVRITVRDQEKKEKYQHLLDIEEKSSGRLFVYEADLLTTNAFDHAIEGADIVMHTASPFFLDDKNDPVKNLIEPAVLGTKNVLGSVNKASSVKKVVLTSSVAAIYGDNKDMSDLGLKALSEEQWNTTSSASHNAYSYSKTEAEKAAWEMASKQERWQLITIHPGFVLGPSLTKRIDSTSINTLLRILKGEIKTGSPDLAFIFSDVRDVAMGHLLAAYTEHAKGRYIIANENGNLLTIGKIINQNYPKEYQVPKNLVPKWLVWIIAPAIGFTRKYVSTNIGYSLNIDNSKSIRELNIQYHSLEETIVDHVKQLQQDHLIEMS